VDLFFFLSRRNIPSLKRLMAAVGGDNLVSSAAGPGDGDPSRATRRSSVSAPPQRVETEEEREQRVAALREQVRTGTYEIPLARLVRILASCLFKQAK
jgi:anti-sigma28 factor (negative regulator of flagellin synthesis)